MKRSESNAVGCSNEVKHILKLKWSHPVTKRTAKPDIISTTRRVLKRVDTSLKLEEYLPKILYTKDMDRRVTHLQEMVGLEYEEKRIP